VKSTPPALIPLREADTLRPAMPGSPFPTPGNLTLPAMPGGILGHLHLPPAQHALVFVVAVPCIYLCMVTMGRLLKRQARVQLSVMFKFFSAVLAIYVPMRALGWTDRDQPYEPALDHDLSAACILLGVIFVLSLLKRYLWEFYFGEKRKMQIPKFLREIFSALFFIAAFMVVLSRIYGVEPSGVVLSSTVVVGIIGWAMQDLLGNVISGVALQLGKPFKAGDWLIIDTQHAEVIEVNWRSTRLRTNDDHYLDIPNSAIVRSTIVNLSYPSHLHAMRMRVGVDADASPNKVKQVLMTAALNSRGVLTSPPPKIFLAEFADYAITYEVKFWMEHHAAYNEIYDNLRTSVWYGLRRAGITIPSPIRTVQIERKKTATFSLPAETRAVIRNKPFFKCLTDEQVQKVVGAARVSLFGKGEKIVEQGAEGTSMFVMLSGEAAVYVHHAGQQGDATRVAGFQPGEYFGEMSLLTGAVRSATVAAVTDCEVIEIAKSQIAAILQENAALLTTLSEMLAQRQMENEKASASKPEEAGGAAIQEEYAKGFLKAVARFFDL
jgi:small-conductance mechanosensitive channel/CRP-like cAMP-binding protein